MTKASRYEAHREGRAVALAALVAAERSLAVTVYHAYTVDPTDSYAVAGAHQAVLAAQDHRDLAMERFERADEDLHRAIWRGRFLPDEAVGG